jgi:hypothetical protein
MEHKIARKMPPPPRRPGYCIENSLFYQVMCCQPITEFVIKGQSVVEEVWKARTSTSMRNSKRTTTEPDNAVLVERARLPQRNTHRLRHLMLRRDLVPRQFLDSLLGPIE